MSPAVKVENLWKEYVVGQSLDRHATFYDTLSRALKAPFKKRDEAAADPTKFWALNDVSFEVQPGEVVGIIGRNGAGKSTLLKVLSRITAPTKGRVEVRGRLASLLEVGTGFHGELSGRENIFLNGAILGMSRRDIAKKFDEIVAFAEVEKFIDTPVKRYSSGMYVRLAFAVAAHLETDVLIVDEVLAVGDAKFQRRCMTKMQDVSQAGATVLFVSHNMTAIQRMCARAVRLEAGRVADRGDSNEVVTRYLSEMQGVATKQEWLDHETAPGSETVRIVSAEAVSLAEQQANLIAVDTGVALTFEYINLRADQHLNLSVHIYTSDDLLVLNAVPVDEPAWFGKPFPEGRYRCRFELPPHLLNSGTYRVELLVVRDQAVILSKHENIVSFEVADVPNGSMWHGRLPGVVRPKIRWETARLTS